MRKLYEQAVMYLMTNEDYIHLSFYSFILAKCTVIYDNRVKTAGVSFNQGRYNLYIGDKFKTWTLDERIAVLVHECRHILGGHVFRKGERKSKLWNKACDIAINQLIENLPEGALYPETYNLPKNLDAESYYSLLEKQEDQDNPPSEAENGSESLDDHDIWDEADGLTEEIRQETQNMVKDAIMKCRGEIPGDIQDVLKKLQKPSKISWKKVLRKYTPSKKSQKRLTIKKRNRRFPNRTELRGHTKKVEKYNIVLCIDTSYSVTDKEIINSLVEIHQLVKVNANPLQVIQVDTKIQKVDIFDPKKPTFTRYGYGGTYMANAIKYIKENNISYDFIIFISDMEIEDVSVDPIWSEFNKTKKKVLWLSTNGLIPTWSNSVKNHRVIDIKDK